MTEGLASFHDTDNGCVNLQRQRTIVYSTTEFSHSAILKHEWAQPKWYIPLYTVAKPEVDYTMQDPQELQLKPGSSPSPIIILINIIIIKQD